MLCQTLNAEFGRRGIHVVHIVIDGAVDAPHEYAAWGQLRDSGQGIEVGDLLETDNGEMRICKYVGFDAAQWVLPAEPAAIPASEELRYTSAEPASGE